MNKPQPAAPTFSLYVSSIEEFTVARFGTRSFIGAVRDPQDPTKITWTPDVIVPIPANEHQKYLREYTRALKPGGGLRVRTAAEYAAQTEAQKAAKKAAVDAAAAAAAAVESTITSSKDSE
jgi:hypothetical protein